MSDHTPASSPFEDKDWDAFRAEDYSAGKAVVALMLAIFLTGVFIYSVVAFWVIKYSHG